MKERYLQKWNGVIEKAVIAGIKPSLFREFIKTQIEMAKRFASKCKDMTCEQYALNIFQ